METKISVIVPVYNVEPYLKTCVDSILGQSYGNLEVFLVDNGSTDSGGVLCDTYAQEDSRVTALHTPNNGISDARNLGLERATGEWLAFVDSDDWLHRDYFRLLMHSAEQTEADIALCDYREVHDGDTVDDAPVAEPDNWTVFSQQQAMHNLYNELYLNTVIAWGKVYARHVFEGVRFPSGRNHEDEAVAHQVLARSERVVFLHSQLYYYRQRAGSVTKSGFRLQNKFDAIAAYEARAEYFASQNMTELRDKTYWTLFRIYQSIFDNFAQIPSADDRRNVLSMMRELRTTLRTTQQTMKFRCLYEAYSLSPYWAGRVLQLVQKARGGRG